MRIARLFDLVTGTNGFLMMKSFTIRSLLIALFAVAGPSVSFGKDGDRGSDSDSGDSDSGGSGSGNSGGGSGNSSGGDSHSGDSSSGRSDSGGGGNSGSSRGSDRNEDRREDRREDGREDRRKNQDDKVQNDQVGPATGAEPNRLRKPEATNLMEYLGIGSEQNKARDEFKRGKIKKLSEVMAAVGNKYPGDIVSVKLKDESRAPVYELKILSSDNRLRKIKVDARTLSIY